MNLELNFSKQYSKYKFKNCTIFLSGSCFINNKLFIGEKLAIKLQEMIEEKTIMNSLLNGFFSFCYIDKDRIIIENDHLRSRSLYYSIIKNNIYISDVAKNISNKLCLLKDNIKKEYLNQFMATGYVFSNNTLFEEIKSFNGGYIYNIDTELGVVKTQHKYTFYHNRLTNKNLSLIKTNYDKVINNIFKRFVEYANGRQIVIPLSAGYDSLLTICILKKIGYKNIITFTYGRKNNSEALISKQVAESLNVKWIFIEYTQEKLDKLWSNKEISAFTDYTMNYQCLPHIQDYLAVKEIKEKQLINNDAIFAPGHCVAGVHFPKILFYKNSHKTSDIVDFLYDYHFVNNRSIVSKNKKAFKEYLYDFCNKHNFSGNSSSFADIVELWQWYEREPKYIVNSIRNYTFFGYDYWMPLWDIEHANFWINMDFKIAADRKWFEWYIDNVYKNLLGKSTDDFKHINKYDKEYILKYTKVREIIKRFIYYKHTKHHPLLFNSIYSKNDYFIQTIFKGNHLLNGYATKFLDSIF